MVLRLAEHVWTIGELMQACLTDRERDPRKPLPGRFRVIKGDERDDLLYLQRSVPGHIQDGD
jgi:hypothetical protein